MTHFWQSGAGEHIRMFRRRMSSLRVVVPIEGPTKKTRRATRERARQALHAAFEDDSLVRYAREQTNWPKPRAHIALDISVTSAARNGARIDSVCKWLLDELNGLVYQDDRQVKLLFARIGRPMADLAAFWGESPSPSVATGRAVETPKIWITAQPRASVLEDLRVASNLDERWDPFKAVYGRGRRSDYESDFERDELRDWRSMLGPTDEEAQWKINQLENQIDYLDQTQPQQQVDLVFSSLLTDLPVDRFGVWRRASSRLAHCPYIFNVGTLPERGETAAFERRLRRLLEDRREQFPTLLPLRARSGISMILFEKHGHSKDLDNLVRQTLPAILDVLRPPVHDHQGWLANAPDLSEVAVDIPFIEIASIPAEMSDMPPGSLVLGLSSADRFSSWWCLVADYVESRLEDDSGHWY